MGEDGVVVFYTMPRRWESTGCMAVERPGVASLACLVSAGVDYFVSYLQLDAYETDQGGNNRKLTKTQLYHNYHGSHCYRFVFRSIVGAGNEKWRPYRESNPGYLREREVS